MIERVHSNPLIVKSFDRPNRELNLEKERGRQIELVYNRYGISSETINKRDKDRNYTPEFLDAMRSSLVMFWAIEKASQKGLTTIEYLRYILKVQMLIDASKDQAR